MKRILLFLILFGAGLGVLLYIDRSQQRESDFPPQQPREEQPLAPEESAGDGESAPAAGSDGGVAEADADPEEAAEQEGPRAELSGRTELRWTDREGGRRYRFQAEDMIPLGGGQYNAVGVRLAVFEEDAGGNSVEATTMVAERGRLAVEFQEGSFGLADEGRVTLFEVEVVQLSGGALVPVAFTAPQLLVDVDDQTFQSLGDDTVQVAGQGLDAVGTGLRVDGQVESFTFAGGGRIRFLGRDASEPPGSDASNVELDTRESGGAVTVLREASGRVRAETSARSRLVAQLPGSGEGDADAGVAVIDSDELELFAAPDPEGRLVPDTGLARGNVVARREPDSFRGQQAELFLGAAGVLERVLLTGAPEVEVLVQEQRQGEIREVPVRVSGEGPLDVRPEEAVTFELSGSSRLESLDGRIEVTATEGISGVVIPDGRRGEFIGRGEVVLLESGFRVETTPELLARIPGDSRRALDVIASGSTRAVSATPQLEMLASAGLELQRRGELWILPEARGVTITESGERQWTMSGGILRDVDWLSRSFEVLEGFRFAGLDIEASSEEASVSGPLEVELRGTPGKPAEVRRVDAAALARGNILRRSGDTVRGEGEVLVELTGEAQSARVEAEMAELELASLPAGVEPGAAPRPYAIRATGVEEARIERGPESTWLGGETLLVEGVLGEQQEPAFEHLLSTGEVDLHYRGSLTVDGVGERFEIFEDGRARLSAAAGERVDAWGQLDQGDMPYELTAEWIEYVPPSNQEDEGTLTAYAPNVLLQTVLLPISPLRDGLPEDEDKGATQFTDARGERLVADSDGIELLGSVRIEGRDRDDRPVVVRTERARLVPAEAGAEEVPELPGQALPPGLASIQEIQLQDGFRLDYADRAHAEGESALITRTRAVFEGDSSGPMAQVKVSGLAMESHLIDLDLESFLVTTTRGILRATGPAGIWSMRFASMVPVEEEAETMVVIGAPVYESGTGGGARADWGVLWIHAETWKERARQELFGIEPTAGMERMVAPPLPIMDLLPNVFRDLKDESVMRFARAIYLDGNAEVTEAEDTVARAGTMYLDLVKAEGWMRDSELLFELEVGSETQQVRTRSAELYTASDGTLAADQATLTACIHDDPHYVVETGGLRIEPRAQGGWRISASSNLLRFQNGFFLPLPPLGDAILDRGGGFRGFEAADGEVYGVESFNFGSSARFGNSVQTGLNSDLGKVGKGVGTILGFDPRFVEGRWVYEGAWLGSRGALLGLGLRLRDTYPDKSPDERFWLDIYASGINDGERDRGIVRVPVDERDSLRTWTRARGRYPFSKKTWIDVAFSTQSDPGVQAEFYQRDYLRWEQRDNFVHWRKARGSDYFNATVQVRLDDYRTDVEKLPALGAYHGQRKLTDVSGLPLLYGTSLDVAYLRRLQGDPRYEFTFPDGPTDRDALRVDNRHKLDLPIALGVGGLRLTPFTEARLTAWSEGFDENTQPTRGALLGGGELSSVYWKTLENQYTHEITPSVRWEQAMLYEDKGGPPILFDASDLPYNSENLDVGIRTRWYRPGKRRSLDLEARAVRLYDRQDGLPDTLQVLTLGSYRDRWGSWPIAVTYDGRFDTDLDSTLYSFTRFGFSPAEPLVMEVGHRRGADETGQRLFESATLAARWRLNPKWELEGRQTVALRDDSRLNNQFTLRRYSHDFILEVGAGYQVGEGGTFTISWRPLLGYDQRPLGLIRDADYR